MSASLRSQPVKRVEGFKPKLEVPAFGDFGEPQIYFPMQKVVIAFFTNIHAGRGKLRRAGVPLESQNNDAPLALGRNGIAVRFTSG